MNEQVQAVINAANSLIIDVEAMDLDEPCQYGPFDHANMIEWPNLTACIANLKGAIKALERPTPYLLNDLEVEDLKMVLAGYVEVDPDMAETVDNLWNKLKEAI